MNSIGIDAYRKRNADAQREYPSRKKLEALKIADIRDRKGRSFDVNILKKSSKRIKTMKK